MGFLSSLNPFGSNSGNSSSSTSASQTDNSLNAGNDSLVNSGTVNITQTAIDAGAVNAAMQAMQDATNSALASNTVTNAAALAAMRDTTDSVLVNNTINNVAAFDTVARTNESALSLAEKTVSGVLDAIAITAQQPSGASGGVMFAPSSGAAETSPIPREYILLAGLLLVGGFLFLKRK